jgi:hypothetical protein
MLSGHSNSRATPLYGGRRFQPLHVLDEDVREALKIVIDTSIQSG